MTPAQRIDDLIAQNPGWMGQLVATVRRLIHEADPQITETWKWVTPNRPGTPCWEHDGIVCHVNVLKERVRLTMSDGASLPDPKHLFNVHLDSRVRRAIDWYEDDVVDEDGVRAIVRAGVAARAARHR